MNNVLFILLAVVGGAGLGTLFFGGLWLTVRKAVSSATPALWFLLSFLLRTVITLIGFYYISQGHWQWLFACLVGFIVARQIVNRYTKLNA